MKNVLYLSSTAAGGGGPRHMLDWMSAVNSRESKAIRLFAAVPADEKFSQPIAREAVDTFTLPERWLSLSSFFGLVAFCRRNQISLVHSFGRISGLYSRPLRFFGLTVIHTPQGVIASSTLKQVVFRIVEPILSFLTLKYVAGSSSEAEQTARKFGVSTQKIAIIPPVVKGADAPTVGVERRFGARGQIRLGYVGRLVAHKRVLEFVAAVIALGARYRAVLFGGGPLASELQKLAERHPRAVTVQPLTGHEFSGDAMDIFVSWSKSESFGLAAAEAMIAGVPVVLSDVPGHRELIAGSTRGWLFDARKLEDFSRVVREVVEQTTEREARVRRAQKEIRELCSESAVALRLEQLYVATP